VEVGALVPCAVKDDFQGNGVPVELAAELVDLDASQFVCKWLDPVALDA
jgi:hypothetical protein